MSATAHKRKSKGEREVLDAHAALKAARAEGNELAADLAEATLNRALERLRRRKQ